jgi:hypothetical protein
MHPAALMAGTLKRPSQGGDETGVLIGDHQLHTAETAGLQPVLNSRGAPHYAGEQVVPLRHRGEGSRPSSGIGYVKRIGVDQLKSSRRSSPGRTSPDS